MTGGWIVRTSRPHHGPAKTILLVGIADGAEALAAVKEFVGSEYTVELGDAVDAAHMTARGIGAGEVRVLRASANRREKAAHKAPNRRAAERTN